MKATELRIGNIISARINEFYTDVTVYEFGNELIRPNSHEYNLCNLRNCKPVPLTEEWLLRLGFENTYRSKFRLKFDNKTHNEIGFDFPRVGDKSMEGLRFYGHYIKINYVHQLQNLYFALTGEELQYDPKVLF